MKDDSLSRFSVDDPIPYRLTRRGRRALGHVPTPSNTAHTAKPEMREPWEDEWEAQYFESVVLRFVASARPRRR